MALIVIAFAAVTCETTDPAEACAPPLAGSNEETLINQARSDAGFTLVFPCYLPNSQVLESIAVVGEPGRQQASFVWTGPFDFTIRQSQYPPAVAPDPSGASRITVDLFPNVRGTLIERNDASGDAQYHLFWQRDNLYYELQAFGPPQQRRIILDIAQSLEPLQQSPE